MFVPEVLQSVSDRIADHPRIQCTATWSSDSEGRWSLPFVALLSGASTEFISAETAWYVVFVPRTKSVTVYPAMIGGISATFQHQSFNREGSGLLPWRLGNPCLDRPAAAFGRASWNGQPDAIDENIVWHLERLLMWIDAAATGELAIEGEPLELPSGPGQTNFPVVGFVGADDDLAFWHGRTNEWGWVDLAKLPGAKISYAMTTFRDRQLAPIRKSVWGRAIAEAAPSKTGLWIALDNLPVLAPWELPRTWADLSAHLDSQGVQLADVFEQAGSDRRRRKDDRGTVTLFLGFPLAELIGEAPSKYHWLAVGSVELSDRTTKKNGFRANEQTRRFIDRTRPTAGSSLTWLRTVNWEPDQIRTRSGFCNGMVSKRVLIIGAGSLGGAVSENLVRMGVTKMGILDPDILDVGNLTRHVLGIDAVGHDKAAALANALNLTMPDVDVRGIVASFPPSTDELAEELRSFDVIIDCTGSDAVLDSMAEFDWGSEKTFVSLAMTWRAEGLLVFTASEATFPAFDAKESFHEMNVPPTDFGDARMEGIGCWHPVFPATAADVRMWGAVGTTTILEAIRLPKRRCQYFRQRFDGTVEKLNG
ncbi:HesA/MoeB/ThiF family protein [Sinorhizobium meliloti]|uniref:HesA/MoeB/ThiF family protein n=3 Tax=Rhizobium meliloti TaxID=382 RepID=UPI0001E4C41B|nr:ThiF family adenylyltransferase [Sinorhizobium meliloti]AEG04145.1 UBA/THIF-type NAD/FAD binding protein [Sinorhizobium meliloti BL225C]ASP70512.1 thiamine biosynthesis protein ThiF [Sinorhizobium meliloti]MDE3828944.1 ThiF family adenylyltransferase [Sinorhizobium meliloti]MDE3854967.1 ThiF family adenylyltransferase [Sinorhizobium meliloti]MDE4545089.1 ThiF family adenylyltransferase [Sinorhizobium meliloti]